MKPTPFRALSLVTIIFLVVLVALYISTAEPHFSKIEPVSQPVELDGTLVQEEFITQDEEVLPTKDEPTKDTTNYERIAELASTGTAPTIVDNGEYEILIVDPETNEQHLVLSGPYRLYAVPEEFDGRIFVYTSGEGEFWFHPMEVDLLNLKTSRTKPLKTVYKTPASFNYLKTLNVLSPTQRYVATALDGTTGGQVQAIHVTDLLDGPEQRLIHPFNEFSMDKPYNPRGQWEEALPNFEITWTSDTCFTYSTYERSVEFPRPFLKYVDFCLDK